jgi:hypothetical protein
MKIIRIMEENISTTFAIIALLAVVAWWLDTTSKIWIITNMP